MNQKIIKNGTNVVVVTKYKDITPELMLIVKATDFCPITDGIACP